MKGTISLFLVATLWAPLGHAGEMWATAHRVIREADGALSGFVIAVDAGGAVYNGNERKTWVYTLKVKGDVITSFLGTRESTRCDRGERAILQAIVFSPENSEVKERRTIDVPRYVLLPPGTLGDNILKFTCGLRKGEPVATKVPAVQRIRATSPQELHAMATDFALVMKARLELQELQEKQTASKQ